MHELLDSHDLWLLLGLAQVAAGARLLGLSVTWWCEAARAGRHGSAAGSLELVG